MSDLMAQVRAYLDRDKWWASLTDEMRARINRNRQILGSLDDTHALNRSERGSGDTLCLVLGATVIGLGCLSLLAPELAPWLIGGSLLWLAASLPIAVGVGRWLGRRHG